MNHQISFYSNFFFYFPSQFISHHCSLPRSFSLCRFLILHRSLGRRQRGGNWQPSLHRLSARLLICMALIIDWGLQLEIYDGLSPLRLPRSYLFCLYSFASKHTPTALLPMLSESFSNILFFFPLINELNQTAASFKRTNTLLSLLYLSVNALNVCFSF